MRVAKLMASPFAPVCDIDIRSALLSGKSAVAATWFYCNDFLIASTSDTTVE
jgi:hypothetical protein